MSFDWASAVFTRKLKFITYQSGSNYFIYVVIDNVSLNFTTQENVQWINTSSAQKHILTFRNRKRYMNSFSDKSYLSIKWEYLYFFGFTTLSFICKVYCAWNLKENLCFCKKFVPTNMDIVLFVAVIFHQNLKIVQQSIEVKKH